MKRFGTCVALSLALLMSVPALSLAAGIHYFDCKLCHKGGVSVTNLGAGNVCLQCHEQGSSYSDSTPAPGPGYDGAVAGRFSAQAASDAFGSNPGATGQTSHTWAASSDRPAAGAQEPTTEQAGFYGRYRVSNGKLTCTRCHNPHGEASDGSGNAMANPSLLIRDSLNANLPMDPEQNCRACHVPFDQQNNNGLLTHPVVVDYDVVLAQPEYQGGGAKAGWLQPAIGNGGGSGTVNNFTGVLRTGTVAAPVVTTYNNGVGCTSCHGPHFTDSSSATGDGLGSNYGNGDGKLLRSDGATRTGGTSAQTAQLRSNLCQACHTFKPHGTTASQIGCLDCHSGHNVGTSNYFVLRNQVGATTGLNFQDLTVDNGGTLTAAQVWSGTSVGDTAGYCERCHGQLTAMPLSGRVHVEGENCRTCHQHDGATYSFEAAGGCDGCHGYPPSQNVAGGNPNAGYAVNGSKNYSTSGVFKDEALTPHPSHSGVGSGYQFTCAQCHNTDFATTHDMGTFQNVLFAGGTFTQLVKPTGSGLNPAYTATGGGSCAQVACHSNGGKRTGDGTNTFKTTVLTWATTKGTITTCDACHGNSSASMAVAQRDNSTSHVKHLDFGYSCNACHKDTATSATALVVGAESVKHVNGLNDVAFAAGGTYTASTGTCSVSCHGTSTPDWDVAATGACGACHVYSNAGAPAGTGPSLGGAHNQHVFDFDGPKLACTVCHTNNGSGVDHVNGSPSFVANYQNNVCNPCHGSTNGVTTGIDRQPVWTSPASVDCETCHTGSAVATINSKPASNKTSATTSGHNRTTNYVSGNLAANKQCLSCHDSAAAGNHLDGITGNDDRLLGSATNCTTTCHGVGGSAVKDSIITHQSESCANCHDPHGSSNIYMVKSTSAGRYSGTVVFTATTGADSYDEVDAVNGDDLCATCHTAANQSQQHNNKTNTGVAHNEGTDCFSCHRPHTNPTVDGGAFATGSGSSCNGCHGFPPVTGAHANHAQSASNDKDIEDRSDCEACHTGAASYTYAPATDRGNSLNHGNAAGRDTLLGTKVGYNNTNQTCATACHNSTVGDGAWTDTALNCNACHYYLAAPTSAGNVINGNSSALGGDHSIHFGVGGIVTCVNCHGTDPLDTTHISLATGNDAQKVQDRAQADMDEATVSAAALGTGSDPDAGNATCNNAACHNPSGTTYSATWNVSAVSCTLCHSNTNPATGSHAAHVNAATLFGINTIACTSCHGAAPGSNAHRTGSVNLLAGMTYTPGAQDVGGTVGSCTTTTCHNNGTLAATAVPTPNWGQASSDCTICHANAPATGEHAKHMANTTFVDGGCVDCHTAANTTSHINSVRNIAGQITDMDLVTAGNQLTAPGGWLGTCANNCHIANTTSDWTSGTNTLACTDCHGSGKVTTPAMDRGWTSTLVSGAHAKHLASTSYVTGANCTNCHNDNTTTHSTLNNVVTTAIGTAAAKISVNPGNGSCTNTCHLSAQASDWTGGSAAITCADCHAAGTYVGGGANLPASGLHAVTPSVSGVRHDQTVAGGCAACHTTLGGLGTHLNGAFTGDTNLGLAAFYTQTAANTGTCVNTSCHLGNAGGTSDDWAHKWMAPANYTNASSACAGCHNDWANTTTIGPWNSGVIHRVAGDTRGQHGANAGTYKCRDCHNLSSDTGANTGYTFTFGSSDWRPVDGTSTHGDGQIQVNNNGSTYNATTGLCATCHAVVDEHAAPDTGWPVVNASGLTITVTCGACHDGSGVSDITGTASGAHATHDAGVGALIDGGAACVPCHGDNSGLGFHNILSGLHGNTTVNFVGVTYSTAIRDDLTGTCSTTSCHNKPGSGVSGPWNGTQLDCDDCHYYVTGTAATQAGNTAHGSPLSADHGVHFGTGGTSLSTCTTCHANAPANGSGDMTHVGGTTSLVDKSNATQDECEVTVTTWVDGTNTCSNVACHNPSNDGHSAVWQVSTSSCALCHADNLTTANPGTGDHTDHMTRSGVFGRAIACIDCHVIPASNRHSDGVAGVQVRNTAGTFGTVATPTTAGACGTNECHNNGSGAAPKNTTYQWGNAVTITDCLECHENNATMASNAHNEHMNAGYTGAACTDCHTAANNALHMNRFTNIAATSTYSLTNSVAIATAPSGTCSTTNCHNRGAAGQSAQSVAWNVAAGTVAGTTDLTCNSCHGDAAAGLTTSHADHINGGKTCAQCHDTLPTTTAHINVKTSMTDGAVAAPGESNVTFVNAAAVTDYTYNSTEHSCYSATNNGLGCHATAGATGAADATRPDWDVAFASTACTNCHTNTTTVAVNPNSGLHNATPSVSAQKHDNSVSGGCAACHNTMPVAGTHKDGTFTADTVANFGLRYYSQTVANSGAGTCATTTCHLGQSDAWAHKWENGLNYYTTAATACLGCHGDLTGGFNTGVDHRSTVGMVNTHSGTGTYKCQECHAMERVAVYPFTFGSNDWAPLNAGNKHGNNAITMNDDGTATTGTYTNWQRGTLANAGKSTCVKCHGWNDVTPHHFVDTTWAEEQIAGASITTSCGSCHGTAGVTPTTASGAHTKHGATAASVAANPASIANCIACHGNDGTGASHNNGTLNFAGPTYSAARGVLTGTCSNATCHYSTVTPAWNATLPGSPAKCTKCHNGGTDTGTVAGSWPSKNKNGTARSDAHSAHLGTALTTISANCVDCHGDNTATHSNASDGITVTTGTKLSAYTAGTCTNSCHGGATADFTDKTPGVVCLDCHAASKIGSFVTSSSSHVDADSTAGTYTTSQCEACHGTANTAYKTAHADNVDGGVNEVEIPTTYGASVLVPTMNRQYTGTFSKIRLGGTATSGYAKDTEAELCWACHDALTTPVSEWGTNQNVSTGNIAYDFGDLYTLNTGSTKTSNWSSGYWRSGRGRVATAGSGTNPYWYKRGAIQSTHSVNFDSGVAALTTTGNSLGFGRKETPDTVANLRCSYCHDVHGTHNGVGGDVSGGAGTADQPYLRGKWRTNPYAEDGAPQLGMNNWTTNGLYGLVPRGSANINNTGITAVPKAGAFWIDQNSGNPTSGITGATALDKANSSSGLCEQCHGANKTGVWTTAALGTLDWATNSVGEANIWVSGYNGHANSVLGGGGRGAAASPESYARNIFTRTKRGTATAAESGSAHPLVDMGVFTSVTTRAYTYRGSMGYNWTPTAGSNTTAFRAFAWGTPVAGVSGRTAGAIWSTGSQALTMSASPGTEAANYDAQANYHTFTCSKCHNPHASRLPKLMITNCLDTNHNTWEDSTGYTGTNPGAPFASTRHSQWGSAQNCHRLDARAALTSGQTVKLGIGWNRVTPWLEFTNPNSTRANITPSIPVP